jgi:hypothetical protein
MSRLNLSFVKFYFIMTPVHLRDQQLKLFGPGRFRGKLKIRFGLGQGWCPLAAYQLLTGAKTTDLRL